MNSNLSESMSRKRVYRRRRPATHGRRRVIRRRIRHGKDPTGDDTIGNAIKHSGYYKYHPPTKTVKIGPITVKKGHDAYYTWEHHRVG